MQLNFRCITAPACWLTAHSQGEHDCKQDRLKHNVQFGGVLAPSFAVFQVDCLPECMTNGGSMPKEVQAHCTSANCVSACPAPHLLNASWQLPHNMGPTPCSSLALGLRRPSPRRLGSDAHSSRGANQELCWFGHPSKTFVKSSPPDILTYIKKHFSRNVVSVGFLCQSNGVHAGLSNSQADEVETSLMAMPAVHMAAHCVVDGEESSEIMESDIVTCAARVMLTRHSHLTPGMLQSCAYSL